MSVDHYENFPVASILCPPALRPAVVAVYHYARTADDLADEGPGTPEQRRAQLQRYRQSLMGALSGQPPTSPQAWPEVFGPLARAVKQFELPAQPLLDLLDAFEQDTHNPPYLSRAALLDYCRRSANPVGRLLLHLYGVHDERSVAQSDAICTALQLINFWQDFSRDHPQGRCYIPHEDAVAHGLPPQALLTLTDNPATQALIRDLVAWSRSLMAQGQSLALRLNGRAGWELRLVVQGGLRILDKIEALDHRSLQRRPRLRAWDLPLLWWRAARMRA
ncbi:MAG: squalene synthase HpnC [Betaproteobacteria bacterium]|nr:squalene synthase HpnC [Betaproteobacteria bacterium]NBT11074.1 squalene synthase HpnC [Betaproteobacteria bacterium]NBU49923.1 squalene synthase HpnC [Betaproteobacteria bacterium]